MTVGELLRDGARCDKSGERWREALEFHAENPWVLDRLRTICFDLRARGFTRYSTRTLVAVLRFEWDLKTTHQQIVIDGGEERSVKINDHFTAYFARMLIERHPELWDFFELRTAEGDPEELPPPPDRTIRDGAQLSLL
jgi:hypothetical protein